MKPKKKKQIMVRMSKLVALNLFDISKKKQQNIDQNRKSLWRALEKIVQVIVTSRVKGNQKLNKDVKLISLVIFILTKKTKQKVPTRNRPSRRCHSSSGKTEKDNETKIGGCG